MDSDQKRKAGKVEAEETQKALRKEAEAAAWPSYTVTMSEVEQKEYFDAHRLQLAAGVRHEDVFLVRTSADSKRDVLVLLRERSCAACGARHSWFRPHWSSTLTVLAAKHPPRAEPLVFPETHVMRDVCLECAEAELAAGNAWMLPVRPRLPALAPVVYDQDGNHLLHRAVRNQDERQLRRLLVDCGIDVNLRTQTSGETALMLAVMRGWLPGVRLLLDADADVGLVVSALKFTALEFATVEVVARTAGALSILALLLERRADPNLARPDGMTPLMVAARLGSASVVDVLLEHKADPAVCHASGATAQSYAVASEHINVAATLAAACAPPAPPAPFPSSAPSFAPASLAPATSSDDS